MKTKNLLVFAATLLIIQLSACSSVTVRPKGGIKDVSEPSYIDSKPFYFWGLVGEHSIDVNEVCDGAEVAQMQTVITVSDWVLGALTFGIYSPRTAKVWCVEDEPAVLNGEGA